ncbi:MAG: molybdopterin-synthase adenylyltransferase MoeB [Gemmatimonadota bacterium]
MSTAGEEAARYHRQIILPQVGTEGQARLSAARVAIIGAGGLGSPGALYLAAAGVGHLTIVDSDEVDLSNLHRQILHSTSSVGTAKVESARNTLRDLNPSVTVRTVAQRLDASNAMDILAGHDVVVDGSDNFPTRYVVNDACVLLGIPLVYGAIFRFEGQAAVFVEGDGPCYRCLFRDPPPADLVPNCAEAGVLGALPGIVGSIQATETLKLLLQTGGTLSGRLLLLDALEMEFRRLTIDRDPDCPACGEGKSLELTDYEELCGVNQQGAGTPGVPEIGVSELKERLDRGEDLTLLDIREPHEWNISNFGDLGAVLIPMGEVSGRVDEIETNRTVIVYCRTGMRSARVVEMLQGLGVEKAFNLRGGINDWAACIDPSMAQY